MRAQHQVSSTWISCCCCIAPQLSSPHHTTHTVGCYSVPCAGNAGSVPGSTSRRRPDSFSCASRLLHRSRLHLQPLHYCLRRAGGRLPIFHRLHYHGRCCQYHPCVEGKWQLIRAHPATPPPPTPAHRVSTLVRPAALGGTWGHSHQLPLPCPPIHPTATQQAHSFLSFPAPLPARPAGVFLPVCHLRPLLPASASPAAAPGRPRACQPRQQLQGRATGHAGDVLQPPWPRPPAECHAAQGAEHQ